MARRYNRSNNSSITRNMSASELGLPGGVIIGKKGATINYMKHNSGAHISLKDDNIRIRGGHKQVMAAKALLNELAANFQNGIAGFRQRQVERPVRRKRPVVRVSSDGWTTAGEMKKAQTEEPTRTTISYNRGQFAGLDFSDSEESDEDERSYPQDDGSDYVSTERYVHHPAWKNSDSVSDEPTIKLTIAEKTRTREVVMALLDKARQILAEEQASCTDSWADAADVDDAQTAVDELEEELAGME
jgi:rRNA processing protein Krr1/Pno1